ncbi:MAG: pantothenate kinase [Elainellaceae cyanobacterium]
MTVPVGEKKSQDISLVLVIGNSRLHWGLVTPAGAIATWDTAHWAEDALQNITDISSILRILLNTAEHSSNDSSHLNLRTINLPAINLRAIIASQSVKPPLWIASVVPKQTQLWQRSLPCRVVTLDEIPLHHLYATLGIDRALALLGAGKKFGFPALVIDGGTALTFSGVNGDRHFIGGAIAPGLRLQERSLSQHTAALPALENREKQLPARWATQTSSAIESGILHILLAGIEEFVWHWWQMYPNGSVVFTGGDGEFLFHHIQQRLSKSSDTSKSSGTSESLNPPVDRLYFCSPLVFEGICTLLESSPL